MRHKLPQFLSLKIPFMIGLTAIAVWPDAAYPVMLERYNQDIRENPQNYLKRVERAVLVLENGDTGETTVDDIDTLLSHSEWHHEGLRLKAIRRHLQGHFDEAKNLIQQNIRDSIYVQEQSRLLADIVLSQKDTAAAINAFRTAWEHGNDETDYINLLSLHRGRSRPPEVLIRQGLNLYPSSPGAVQTIFDMYMSDGDSISLRKALEISVRAENVLWPLSVDWKIRHAQVLFALKRPREMEPVLLAALDLLDGDPRLKGNYGEQFRKQIFKLLEAARK